MRNRFLDTVLMRRAEEQAHEARNPATKTEPPPKTYAKGGGRKSAPVRNEQIRALVARGLNNCEIGRLVRLDPSGVRRARERMGLEASPARSGWQEGRKRGERVWTPERLATLIRLMEAGWSDAEAAVELGVTHRAVIKARERFRIRREAA